MPCSAQPVQRAHQHPAEEAHQELGHDGEDPDRHQRVGDGQRQEQLRDASSPASAARTMPSTAASTMKTAFWMFMPAITRDSSSLRRAALDQREQRHHEEAGEQADADQVERRSASCPAARRNCRRRPARATGAAPLRAKYRSSRKALMPNAPSGTRPISTVRADSFSHSSEPTPVPIENSASAKMYSVCVAAQVAPRRRSAAARSAPCRRTRTRTRRGSSCAPPAACAPGAAPPAIRESGSS